MDYNKLLQRLAELDQPTNEACGEMSPPATSTPPTAPPSMSVNLNAQGMDNIEQLMKLMTKVNPDMINPSQASPDSAAMLKLPVGMPGEGDLDSDESNLVSDVTGAEIESREDYANEPDEEVKDIDYVLNKVSGGLNRPQGTYPKVAGGDNPMQKPRMEGDELRAAIRTELQQRLAEAKGAK